MNNANGKTVQMPANMLWRVWVGREAEGPQKERGKLTLFIRSLDTPNDPVVLSQVDFSVFKTHKRFPGEEIRRVWFCREYTRLAQWNVVNAFRKVFDEVFIECTPGSFDSLPKELRLAATIVVKVPLMLKDGDWVCVGGAYQDETFVIGGGSKVDLIEFSKDIKLL